MQAASQLIIGPVALDVITPLELEAETPVAVVPTLVDVVLVLVPVPVAACELEVVVLVLAPPAPLVLVTDPPHAAKLTSPTMLAMPKKPTAVDVCMFIPLPELPREPSASPPRADRPARRRITRVAHP